MHVKLAVVGGWVPVVSPPQCSSQDCSCGDLKMPWLKSNWPCKLRNGFTWSLTRLDGSQVESWESPSGQVSASKWPEEIRLVDKSNSIEQVYDVAQKKLTRLELDERQLPDTMRTLIDVLLGDADRSSFLKVSQRQLVSVTENGETWDEVTIIAEPIGGQAFTWICKIDPTTHLPISYRTQVPTGRNFELGWVEGKFDYPSKGPLTIAELGVPADAELDDRIPR